MIPLLSTLRMPEDSVVGIRSQDNLILIPAARGSLSMAR